MREDMQVMGAMLPEHLVATFPASICALKCHFAMLLWQLGSTSAYIQAEVHRFSIHYNMMLRGKSCN